MLRRFGVLAFLILVLSLLVWAGVHNLRERREAVEAARGKIITLTKDGANGSGESLEAEGASLRGKPAPSFTLTDTSGKRVSLADFKGKPVVVNFWATWCAPCKLEMPWFEEFSAKYKAQGLTVLGLSQDDGASKEEIATAAKHLRVSYPILLPDDGVAKKYGGVDYLPETFYVTRDGVVQAATAGAPSKDEMENNIQRILGNSETASR